MNFLRKIWNHINTTLNIHVHDVLCKAGKIFSSDDKPSAETLKACQKASVELSQLNAGTSRTKK